MDSNAPTTGKPNAARFMQDTEVSSSTDKVGQRWRTWLVVLLVAGVVLYFLIGRSRGAADTSAQASAMAHPTVPVAAAPAKTGDLNQYISAIGSVTSYNTVTVKSRVDGQLDKVNFTEGQLVKAGDLLAEIDPRPYQVELVQAEGTLAKDQASLNNARTLLARDKALYDQQIIARQDLDNQEAAVGQFAGSIESDKGAVANAKLQLTYSRITSPITGRVALMIGCGGRSLGQSSLANPTTVKSPIPLGVQPVRDMSRSDDSYVDRAKRDLDSCHAYRVESLPGSHKFGSEFIVAMLGSRPGGQRERRCVGAYGRP